MSCSQIARGLRERAGSFLALAEQYPCDRFIAGDQAAAGVLNAGASVLEALPRLPGVVREGAEDAAVVGLFLASSLIHQKSEDEPNIPDAPLTEKSETAFLVTTAGIFAATVFGTAVGVRKLLTRKRN